MCKCGSRSRVGQVIGRDIDSLYRCDRTVTRRGNTLLQRADLIRQRRLIANGGRHTAHQGGHLRTCLYITEDVVYEQQHVLLLAVTEVLRHGQSGQRNAHTCSRRFLHLTEHQRGVVQYAGFAHFTPQIVALTGAFADAGKDGVAAVLCGNISNQLLNQDGLADTGAAEQADFTAAGIWS